MSQSTTYRLSGSFRRRNQLLKPFRLVNGQHTPPVFAIHPQLVSVNKH